MNAPKLAPTSSAPPKSPPCTPYSRPSRIIRGLIDPLGFLIHLESAFGAAVTIRPGRLYAFFDPDSVKHILQDNYPNYQKGAMYRAALFPLMGNGLFTSEGPFWLRQRRIAQGAFQRAQYTAFADNVIHCIASAVEDWFLKARRGEAIFLRRELTALALKFTLRNLFSEDASPQMPALIKAIFGVNDVMNLPASFLPVHIPRWIPTPSHRKFARSLRVIDDFVQDIIRRRKAAADPGSDLVGLFISARDPETGESMDEVQLRDELVTVLNAGHDTVTDALVWALVLLAQNRQALERARAEVLSIAGTDWPTVESLSRMDFLGRVFRESLRLYPPAWVFSRDATNADHIGGFDIPAGAMVILSPYATQRSPRYWDHPERFDPDRFLPGASSGRHKFAYFPFGGGPRLCIGSHLVMMEAPLVLASLLQRFDFELLPGEDPVPSPRISLRPKRDPRMHFRPL
jgi:cytochrome P450